MADYDELFEESGDEDVQQEDPDAELRKQLEDSDDNEVQDNGAQDVGHEGSSGQEEEGQADDAEELRRQAEAKPPLELEVPLVALRPRQELQLLKLSNVISVESRPFDPKAFTLEQETYVDEQGKERLRLRTGNVIRWRYKKLPSGRMEKESNARFVKWSDGTWQFMLGDEVFNVKKQDITKDNSYLFVSNGQELQAQVALDSKLLVRPSDLNSKSHRRLAEMAKSRHSRVTKVGSHHVLANPEKEMTQRIRDAEQQNTSRVTLEKKRATMNQKYSQAAPRKTHAHTLEEMLDEEDDVEDGGDYMDAQRGRSGRRYDEAAEEEHARRLQAAKRGGAAPAAKRPREESEEEDEEDEDVEYEDDAEEEEEPEAVDTDAEEAAEEVEEEQPKKKKSKEAPKAAAVPKIKARKAVLVSSDEED